MRKVVRAVFDNPHDISTESVAKSEELKKLIKSQLPEVIKLALDHNKQYASVFEINDSNVYLEVHKKNWVQALETCSLWYVEEENYEMCASIKELILQIKNKGRNNKIDLKTDDSGEGF
jgi:hypothetical protein